MAMPHCCAKLRSRLGAAQRELARLARLEAYHAQQCHNVSKFPEMIRSQRAEIAKVKAQIEEHDSEHAGVPA